MIRHISEGALEELAMGRLSRYRSERLQQHLRSCAVCQERFTIECEIRNMVKEAGRKLGTATEWTAPSGQGHVGALAEKMGARLKLGSADQRLRESDVVGSWPVSVVGS